MGAVLIRQGAAVPLALQLPDGATGMDPRAEVRNAAGALLATRTLTHVASGSYTDFGYPMPAEAALIVTYIVYTAAGPPTESPDHLRGQDVFVRDLSAQPSDAMDLITDAVDSAAVATSGAQEIRDEILADATRFNGADVASVQGGVTTLLARLTVTRAAALDKIDGIDTNAELLRKIQTNRLELVEGDSDNWVLYDDNNVDMLLAWNVTDKNGDAIRMNAFVPAKRSKA